MAMQNALEQQLLGAAKAVEDQLDAEIDKLEKMDDDDLDKIREKRLQQMKKAHEQKQEWISKGHGCYDEIADEKEFFDTNRKSKRVVCHFYRDSTFRCKIVDKHLALLATKHVETRFVKINVDKCQFLVDRLRIKVLPTICLAKDGKTVDYVVGFDDMGGHDEFSTEMMEWRIARADVISYNGDLITPPTLSSSKKNAKKNKIIRGKDEEDSDDDY